MSTQISIANIDQKTFEQVLGILKELSYEVKEPPRLKNNVLADTLGETLAACLGKLDNKELNTLYRAVHFLKIYNLRRAIAAVAASRVFINPTLEEYRSKVKELDLKEEINTERSKEFKERFPFMN